VESVYKFDARVAWANSTSWQAYTVCCRFKIPMCFVTECAAAHWPRQRKDFAAETEKREGLERKGTCHSLCRVL